MSKSTIVNRHRNRVADLIGSPTIVEPMNGKEQVTIAAPNFKTAEFAITGTSPLLANKMSAKVKQQIQAGQEAGSVAKAGKKRSPKDFDALYKDACYVADEGWYGIPCNAFRSAMIAACRVCGYKMTVAKLAITRVECDGYDKDEASPIVKITKGQPSKHIGATRNANGSLDLRARPIWQPGWKATVRVTFDSDMLGVQDVANLLSRAGAQVGILELRPNSRNSFGGSFGLFSVDGK